MGKMEQEEHEVGEPVYGASVELVQRVRKQVQTEERKNYFYRGLLSGLLVALLILSSVYVITTIQRRNRQNQGESVTQQELSAFNEKTYDKMREIEKLIYAEYYENDIDADAMENGVYRGIVASLGDQYAQYYTPNEYHSQMISSEGIYFGIGASVGFDAVTGSPELVTINKNSAAEEIG
ncbi:MAG: hypothetical protein LBM69_05650, partial [Lachnospiraceae bacterium]|nr:hypothetical protein [Lachnospiraceae bacterium]